MTNANLGAHIEAVASQLLGEPESEKSTARPTAVRHREHGTSVSIGGNKDGTVVSTTTAMKVGGGVWS